MEDKILLFTQPANSPDTNINYLGLFRALDAAYHANAPQNYEEIIHQVQATYNDYSYKKINRVYLTLMSCLNEIIDHNGDNDYKLPHMGKERLERLGLLPQTLEVTPAANRFFESVDE